ncbi:MAG: NADH-quinone oxidoreductase subunit M [Bacteroidetes bacterium]|nr:NADH-quinone oxidoreductase subunit M [Bacteroidota bacterium]MCA6442712.1 NADH-quinone oxidoreductase subunit M [Bacteroidota bacterium]
MLSLLLIVVPFLSALLLFVSKSKSTKQISLFSTIITFGIAVAAMFMVKHNPNTNLLQLDLNWIPSLGIHFNIEINMLSSLLVLLTAFLLPLIVLSAFKNEYANEHQFYGLMLMMQSALMGVFMTNDGFLFYVFWELALIPIYFICLLWGGENRAAITFKFFVYTLLGSLFMLVGLIYVYNHTNIDGMKSWNINALYEAGRSLNADQQGVVFWLIFIAFAIKMPIFPFHTWQPNTYVNAPTQGTMLLSGIMLKMGTFALIKWLLPLTPIGLQDCGHTAIILSVIGIVYASCIAIVQKDYKRLIAYSSIAHVGLISAGILTANQQGLQGAIMQMLAHGVNVVALFLIADILLRHTGTRELDKLGGIRNMNGNFAVLFLIVVLGSVALPLTNGFVGEFLLLSGVYKYNAAIAGFAGLSVILGAVYMLRSYQHIMLGERIDNHNTFGALATSDKAVLIIACIAIVAFGIYPAPLNSMAEQGIKELLAIIKPN